MKLHSTARPTSYRKDYLKFKREIATHGFGTILSMLLLFATHIQVILSCQSTGLFQWISSVEMATRLEIIAITLELKLDQ